MDSKQNSVRLASLDALRGFDMFFIMGGSVLIAGICAALGCKDCWLALQMRHVPWAGLAQHDTIFPLFLFLAGVSWPFSLAAQRARGRTPFQIHRKLVIRSLTLFLIGLSFGGFLKWNPNFRLSSVLGFIGLSWGVAALLFYHVETTWKRIAVFLAIFFGYFALLHFGVASGAPAGADTYSRQWNIVAGIDRIIWPNHLFVKGVYDPESLASLPGGVLVALLGMGAGALLRSGLTPSRKALSLFAASVVTLLVTLVLVWIVKVPMVKALWTVSFVTAAATYSLALLALFYWIVDVKGWKKWTVVFDPVGKNSILVYVSKMIGVTGCILNFLLGGTIAKFKDWGCADWSAAATGFATFLVTWGLARFFQKHNVFLKV